MSLNDVSIVYVRRSFYEDLSDIMALTDQCYDNHTTDFLVIDVSRDDEALSVLARAGDPFRYFAVPTVDILGIIEFALIMTINKKLIIIDDLAKNTRSLVYNSRTVRFVPESFRP